MNETSKVLNKQRFKKKIWNRWWFWIILVAIFLLAWKAYGYWEYSQSNAYKMAVEYREQYRSAVKEMKDRDNALQDTNDMLKADTYGGSTPEETIRMFVDALKAKDAALASKYYLPWLQKDAKKDMRDWIGNNPKAVQKFISAYIDYGIETKELVSGVLVKVLNGDNKPPYGITMESNKVNNLWKITDF